MVFVFCLICLFFVFVTVVCDMSSKPFVLYLARAVHVVYETRAFHVFAYFPQNLPCAGIIVAFGL